MDQARVDLNRALELTPETAAAIRDLFEYHAWDELQRQAGQGVRSALITAYEVIVATVPPCPTRTRALNMLVDARMLCNSAITFKGRY